MAAAPLLDRRDAMERCAERVVALRRPGGMVDVTDMRFEWLQASTAGAEWVIIGSIVERDGRGEIAHRFTCRTRGDRPPSVSFGKPIRLRGVSALGPSAIGRHDPAQ